VALAVSPLQIDHVVVAVADLDVAGRELEVEYGLASVPGGRHPGWGTANRIVPLGESYLELVGVVDAAEAARAEDDFGRIVGAAADAEAGNPLLGWVVRTDDLDRIAQRLGLGTVAGSRVTPAGEVLRWRTAGRDLLDAAPSLPFFIEWDRQSRFPGQAPAAHRAGSAAITRVDLAGDAERLSEWLGPHDLPITIAEGRSAIRRVLIGTTAGEIEIGGEIRW
jgi:hypothetical protein